MRKILFILAFCFMFFGCETEKTTTAETNYCYSQLPLQATNVVYLDNDWCTFYFDGQKFLFHHSAGGYAVWESLTVIKDE